MLHGSYGIREKSYKVDLSMWYVKNRWASEKSSQLFLGFERAFLLKFISWSRSNTMLKLMLYQFLKAWTTNSGITVWWRLKSAKYQPKCGSLFEGVVIMQEMMSEWVISWFLGKNLEKICLWFVAFKWHDLLIISHLHRYCDYHFGNNSNNF